MTAAFNAADSFLEQLWKGNQICKQISEVIDFDSEQQSVQTWNFS